MLKKLIQIAVRLGTNLMRCDECETHKAELAEFGLVAEEQREQARKWAKSAIDRAAQIVALQESVSEQAELAFRMRTKWQTCLKELEGRPTGMITHCFEAADSPHAPSDRLGVCPVCYDNAVERSAAFGSCSRCDNPTPPPVPLCSECEGEK